METAAKGIRQAIASGEFAKAQNLWETYATELLADLQGGRPAAERLHEAAALVEWSRNFILCERAQIVERLRVLRVAGEYTEPAPPSAPCIIQKSL